MSPFGGGRGRCYLIENFKKGFSSIQEEYYADRRF